MKVVLITFLVQVFLNPQLHTAVSSQNESIDGTAKAPPPDQTTSQEPLAASLAEPGVTVTEKGSQSANRNREEHVVAQNSNTQASVENVELRVSSGHEENDAIQRSTDTMDVHYRSDTLSLPNPSETAVYPQTSISVDTSPTPPPTPPINTPSSPQEGGEDVLTFEEFKKKREQEMPRPSELESRPQLPLNKAKNNYASFECGARVIETNEEAQNPMAILIENKDAYMLNPCKANISFTVELCDTVRILKLELGCFELFSSVPETFRVCSSERYPTGEWNIMGEFNANNERVLQSFVPKESAYAKFVKVEMLSHYGKEHYCPISIFRVIGASLVEEFEYSETRKTTIAPSIDEESDEYLQLGEEQGPGNGRLLAVAKDAVLSLLEPFSRLGNGLIHKDKASTCTDNSDGLPPVAQSPLLEKLQDTGVSLEIQELPDQTIVEQVLPVSGTVENFQKSNSGGVFGEQDAFPDGNTVLHVPSNTAARERTEHSILPSLTPTTTEALQLPTETDSIIFQTSAGYLEGGVAPSSVAGRLHSIVSHSAAAGPSAIPGQEKSSLAPVISQATPASELRQDIPAVPLDEGGVVITPDFPNGILRPVVTPDVTMSRGVAPDGNMLGPHTVDTPRSSHESVTTPQTGLQEDAKSGPHAMHGKGDGEEGGSGTLDASTAAPVVLPSSDTEKGPLQPDCNTSSTTLSTDGDSPPSSSSSSSPSLPSSIPSVGPNLHLEFTNDSHPQWVGGGAGGSVQDHGSTMPAPGSVPREKSVLLRLNERVKNVEENVSLLSSYIEQVTNSLRKNKNKTDEVQRALDRNLQTLSDTMQELNATITATAQRLKRVEENLQSKSFDSIEAHLESIGKTVLNQQLLLFTLSCLTAVLMLLLIILILFLCLIRGCGQRTPQAVGTPPPAKAELKSNVKMAHSIGGGVVLEDVTHSIGGGVVLEDVTASKVAQHCRMIDLTLNQEDIGLLEKKKRKGKRNNHKVQ